MGLIWRQWRYSRKLIQEVLSNVQTWSQTYTDGFYDSKKQRNISFHNTQERILLNDS